MTGTGKAWSVYHGVSMPCPPDRTVLHKFRSRSRQIIMQMSHRNCLAPVHRDMAWTQD